jgi:hypothetical protein
MLLLTSSSHSFRQPVIVIEPAEVKSKGVWAVRGQSNIIDHDLNLWSYAGTGNFIANATASLRVVHVKGAEGKERGTWSKFVRNKK